MSPGARIDSIAGCIYPSLEIVPIAYMSEKSAATTAANITNATHPKAIKPVASPPITINPIPKFTGCREAESNFSDRNYTSQQRGYLWVWRGRVRAGNWSWRLSKGSQLPE
jgi:hypothetical protein